MSFEIIAPKSRTTDYSGSLYQADGTTPVVLAAADVVRFKLGRGVGATPLLDLTQSATANGSVVTVTSRGVAATSPATYTVRLAQADLASIFAGAYDAEVSVVIDAETAPADAIKHVEIGVAHIVGMPGGNQGLSP